ncbi:sulfate permease [Hydrogenophaga sp. PAMC20947]|uniref:SulP family inorganic anion transporter n=1 Tax=Hydrogenophaga sp. PAMC20947 TaxID=2565558 RepID=UPI00109DF105|nr:sulfate permease [Hydrogenophaga sp. PAMC20947]QCB47959.1 sulfate permease [Hydrogenophaga sp. PAMC20947]
MKNPLTHWLPILRWAPQYRAEHLAADGVAAAVVTLMLIPQSLAYALLAGMPAQTGLYASMLPLVAYAVFGTSNTLAVGPAAITSIMTASALGTMALAGSVGYVAAVALLTLMSGIMLFLMGALRLGVIANFLSHPVISGFVSASGLLIAASQLKHLLGIPLQGQTLPQLATSLGQHIGQWQAPAAAIGLLTLVFLVWARRSFKVRLRALGLQPMASDVIAKAAPVLALAVATLIAWGLRLEDGGLRVVGAVPGGLPPLTLPKLDANLWPQVQQLATAALLISLVGFVESVSLGQSLAAKRRERIEPDAELRGLGAANIAAGLTGGFPVTGGFSRSVVNFDAGARTPAAGIYTAIGLLLAALLLTPALYHLPQTALAATIVASVLTLVDVHAFGRTWRYARTDFTALALTFVLTLAVGIEAGLMAGVGVSLLLHLWRTSRPHIATVGRVPGTEHYRNVLRHTVETHPGVLGLRVDESLYFANARPLEDHIAAEVAAHPDIKHVVLQCSAINAIDASALESLEAITLRLKDAGVKLHLSEVKGPVMDRLERSDFLQQLTGRVFLTHHQAVTALTQPPA